MSYATGSYTDQDDALDKFYKWAGNTLGGATNAYPWTQNNYSSDGTGYRAHIQKTIGSTTAYFNFRSAVAETIAPWVVTRGILVNGSTAWAGTGTAWNLQTGYTTSTYSSSTTVMGGIEDIKASGGTYHFFATASSLTMVLETESNEDDWRMITVGTVGGYIGYFASGSSRDAYIAGNYEAQSSYCARTDTGVTATQINHCSLYIPTEGWYGMRNTASNTNTRIMHNIVDSTGASLSSDTYGSTAAPIVAYTPDLFRGNAQLAPSLVTIKKGIASEVWPIGEIEGVKFLNMTNYSNEDEITYDTDTYKLFHIFNSSQTGVAFLK